MSIKKGCVSANGWRPVQKIRQLMEREREITISHSYREANMCADGLANIGCRSSTNLIVYDDCPNQIRQVYLDDVEGVPTPLLV